MTWESCSRNHRSNSENSSLKFCFSGNNPDTNICIRILQDTEFLVHLSLSPSPSLYIYLYVYIYKHIYTHILRDLLKGTGSWDYGGWEVPQSPLYIPAPQEGSGLVHRPELWRQMEISVLLVQSAEDGGRWGEEMERERDWLLSFDWGRTSFPEHLHSI